MTQNDDARSKSQAQSQSSAGSSSDFVPISFANQFLIAMPGMVDDNFAGTVVYLCDHTTSGAMGLVINRPTDVDLATVFDKVDLQLEIQPKAQEPVYFGGPVQTDRGFVLHEQKQGEHTTHYNSSLRVPGGLAMTTSKDVLEEVAAGHGLSRFLMALGYAGWSAGQLEDEIARNGWLNVPARTEELAHIIFDTPDEYKYQNVLALLGIEQSFLSNFAGHA
jgi:putative transcriptional regulator